MTSNKTITLTQVHNPIDRLDRTTILWEYKPGHTVANMRSTLPAQVDFAISVNGHVVDETYMIKPFDHVVFMPVFRGGGGGKQIGMMIAMIAVVAFAAWAGPAAGMALFGEAAVADAVAAGGLTASFATVAGAATSLLVGGAILAGGYMLMQSMASSGQPSMDAISMDKSQAYSWNPATIQQQGMAIPKWYGRNRVQGNIIGAYLTSSGTKQTLNALIALGLGPINQIKNFYINNQPEFDAQGNRIYKDLTFISRPGAMYQSVIPYFNDTRTERSINIKIPKATPYTFTTISTNVDAIEVVLTASQGLWYADNNGSFSTHSVDMKVEIRKQGTSTWYPITSTTQTYVTENKTGWFAGYWQDIVIGDVNSKAWVTIATGEVDYSTTVTVDEYITTVPYHYEGDVYANDSSIRWHYFYNESVFVKSTATDHATLTGKSQVVLRNTFRADNLESAIYEVRVTRVSDDVTDTRYGDDIYFSTCTEIINDDFTYPRVALVGIQALATDQLSGSLRFSCDIEGSLVRVYTGGAWHIMYSNNPAWIMYDILTQPVIVENRTSQTVDVINRWTGTQSITTMIPDGTFTVSRYDGIDPSKLDLNAFVDLATYCLELVSDGKGGTEARFEFNGGFDREVDMWSAALMVGRTCFATPVWSGSRLTLIIDKPSDPVQLFTVGNTLQDTFTERFIPMAERAAEIECDFMDESKDYNRTKVVIMNPDIPSTVNKVSLQMIGVTRESQAWRSAQRTLAYNQYVTRVIGWQADIDAIACQVGDVVLLQSDVPVWGFGGRLAGVNSATEIELDKTVTLLSGKSYVVMVTTTDGTMQERSVTSDVGDHTTLTVSVAFSPVPALYDVWAFGETGLSSKPVKITDISRSGDFKATLTAIDYHASVYTTDSGTPVIAPINYSSLASLNETVKNLQWSEELYITNTKSAVKTRVLLKWDAQQYFAVSNYEIEMNTGLAWEATGTSITPDFAINDVQPGTVSFRVRTVNNVGIKSEWNTVSATVLGKTAPPADVSWCVIQGRRLDFGVVTDLDLAGYEVRYQIGYLVRWDTASKAHEGLANSPFMLPPLPPNNYTIMVKAVDTTGNYSLNPVFGLVTYQDSTLLGERPVANVVETFDRAAASWPGTLSFGTRSAGDIVAANDGLFWASDGYDMWSYNAGNIMFAGSYSDMIYTDSITVTAALQNAQMTIDTDLSGNFPSVSYRLSGHLQMWSAQPNDAMWNAADSTFWATADYMPWPGAVNTQPGTYEFKLSAGSGPLEGRASSLIITIDAPDIDEYLKDVNISAVGTRLALAKTYNTIKTVGLTMQEDGGTAVRASVIDKSAAGPLIETYNGAGTKVTGRVDVHIQGY